MNIPLPEFFRYYGEILSGEGGASFQVFAVLAGAVALVFVWFVVGAGFEGIYRWWTRSRGGVPPESPSARSPAGEDGGRSPHRL